MNDHPLPDTEPEGPDEPDELDEWRGERLRQLLDDGGPGVDEAMPADLPRRADARRQRKVAGLGLAAALALVVGGSAFALTHKDRAGSAELGVAAAPSTGERGSPTTITGAQPVDGPPVACDVPLPPDSLAPAHVCATTTSSEVGSSEVVAPTGSVLPTTFEPSSSTTGKAPVTTIPSTTPTSDHGTQTTELPRDCGSWAPIGWPTTAVPSRTLGQCLLTAFDAGADARLTVKQYQGDPEHTITTVYVVVGVHVVQVGTTTAAPGQQSGGSVVRCTSLVDAWPDGSLVHAADCSPA